MTAVQSPIDRDAEVAGRAGDVRPPDPSWPPRAS